MIKIKCRRDLLYLLVYYISAFLDYTVIGNIINSKFDFDPSVDCIILFPFENIIGGLIVFLYQRHSINKKEKYKYLGVKIFDSKKKVISDRKWKKILLILIASYFSFFNLIISAVYLTSYIPSSMDLRLSSIQIIASALICMYAFDFKFKKHHKISIIIIGCFMFISISIDIILIVYYKFKNISIPIFHYFLTLFYYIGFSFNNCIEKYLVDTNYMNPFIILMIEGVFQILMAGIVSIFTNPFEGIKNNKKIIKDKILFICLYTLFFILQIVVNVYRIYCNVIYSPMARSLIDYLLNPFIYIFLYFLEHEFFDNLVYFIITEFICLVMSFFGCVFNEYIILYFCGLHHETQDEIANRALAYSNAKFQYELDEITKKEKHEDDENNANDENEEKDSISHSFKSSNTIISFEHYNVNI